jgi:enhancing lycopene biosynthesis protein 2
MVLAKVLGRYEVALTLGPDDNAASQVAKGFGCKVQACGPTDVCVDAEHNVITTPAYMAASHISEIFDGAEHMVAELEQMLNNPEKHSL